jgi:hypothetical protein
MRNPHAPGFWRDALVVATSRPYTWVLRFTLPTLHRRPSPRTAAPAGTRAPSVHRRRRPPAIALRRPATDPIRQSAPLLGPTRSNPLTGNNAKPTPPEKQAIKVWLQVRERAQRYVAEQRGEPSALLIKTRNRVTEAILQLYSGRLSYGEFARRIQQIDEQPQAVVRQPIGHK